MSLNHKSAPRLVGACALAILALTNVAQAQMGQGQGSGQGGVFGNMMGGNWGWGMGGGMGGFGGIGLVVVALVVLGIAVVAFRRRTL